MEMASIHLVFGTLVGLIYCVNGDWLNEYDKPVDFSCPKGEYVFRMISQHSNKAEDRQWDFRCRSGPVGDECAWSPNYNSYDAEINYACPDKHIMTGLKSHHDNRAEDRQWKFRCCKITTKPGTGCGWTPHINQYDKYMDKELYRGYAIIGIKSTHSNKAEDRVWQLKTCKFAVCSASSLEIIDNIVASRDSDKIVGLVTSQGCHPGQSYSVNLRYTESVTESQSITITKGKSFTFNTAISVTSSFKTEVLGTGVTFKVGVSQSLGGSTTYSKGTTEQKSVSEGSWALNQMAYTGPGAALILGYTTAFKFDRSNVRAKARINCDDGISYDEQITLTLRSTTYGQTHFTQSSARFYSGKCTSSTDQCIRNIEGQSALDPEIVKTAFRRCLTNIAAVYRR